MEILADTLKLALPLLCIFGIVWLFLHYGRNFTQEKPRTSILYICGYALLIIIELIVYICLNNFQSKDIINTVSFGATLSSLIMSVVAIIFTIVSGKNGEEQLGKITQATKELQHTAKALTEFRAIALTITDRVDDLDSKICENIEQGKVTHMEVKATHSDLLNQMNANAKSTEPEKDNKTKIDISAFTKNGSFLGALALLACCYSKDKDLVWKVDEMGKGFAESNMQYINGYLIAAYACGIINFHGQIPNITTSEYAEGLPEAALKKVIDFIKSEDSSDFRNDLTQELHSLQSYFSIPPTQIPEY